MEIYLKLFKGINLKKVFLDKSLWPIIFSNVLLLIFAIIDNTSILYLMMVYWMQSVSIGFFNFIRILSLKKFSTKGFKIGNQQPLPTENTKIFTAIFFAFHYGVFHLGYLIFLSTSTLIGSFAGFNAFELLMILVIGFSFFVSHAYSYKYNKKVDPKIPNIGRLMFMPYARVIPMHLTIAFGLPVIAIFGNIIIFFFIGLKIIADIAMHIIEHNLSD